jgi:hypothetical protein
MPEETGTINQNNQPSLDELMAELKTVDLKYKKEKDSETPGQRVEIQINNVTLEEQTELSLRALHSHNKPPRIFSRACALCRIRYDERNVALIEPIDKFSLRYYLARCAYFIKISADKKEKGVFHKTHYAPPMDITYDILASTDQEFPQLIALCHTPILQPNGMVSVKPGYDQKTQLYFAPSDGCTFPDVPQEIKSGDVLTATTLIKEVISDFPFVDEYSRANAIAAMITPILRPIIQGNVPMCVIGKPQAGTGASLLCDVISIIATGQAMPTITEQKTEEEWQKVITSILRGGQVLITVDNVEGKLHAPTLAALLTSTIFQGRILGKTEMVTFPNRTVWIANGNNIQLGGDLPRRCFSVKMDAKTAQPWMRNIQYQHPDLRQWVKENRGWIVSSIIIIAAAWIRAGRPLPENYKVLGSFEEWCIIISGVLEFAGIQGFLGNLEEMYENMDQDTAQWEVFLFTWYKNYGEREVGVSELYDTLKRENDSRDPLFTTQSLYSALPSYLCDDFQRKSSFVRKLGNALSKKDGVCFTSGLKFVKSSTKKHAVLWKVVVWDQNLYNNGGKNEDATSNI